MHHKCRSQYVIPFYGITKAPANGYAMIIRYAEYGDLRSYIRRFPLTWTNKANILIKLSKALNFFHQMNLLHKDFHCKNILVDEENRVVISDFELCQPIDSEIGKIKNINLFFILDTINNLYLTYKFQISFEESYLISHLKF